MGSEAHTVGAAPRAPRDPRRGIAMLVVVAWLALMMAVIGEFTYGTTVDAAQAANARDELRAHYMARSAVNLSRLLVKIQQQFIDPIMAQAQKAFNDAGGGSLGLSLRVTDYAPMLMGLFSGNKMEVSALTSIVGIDASQITGLGMKAGRFDAEITPDDGRIDINCGSGPPNSVAKQRQLTVYRLLIALMYSPRYDKIFTTPDSSGRPPPDRDAVARGLIDWADSDDQLFSPEGASASEDYRYRDRRDPYYAHDNSYDTVEEMAQVRGATDEFMEAFSPQLTVYAHDPECRVNIGALKGDCTPLVMGILRAASVPVANQPPSDPQVLDDRIMFPIASLICERAGAGGLDSVDGLVALLQNPVNLVSPEDPRRPLFQSMAAINIPKAELGKLVYTGPARVYRVVATGEAGKVKKKITAIVDTGRSLDNPITINPASEKAAGVLQLWREE